MPKPGLDAAFHKGRISQLTNQNRPLRSDDKSEESTLEQPKKAWQRMRLTYTGEAKDVVQGGGGKFSTMPSDPGEPKKPTGQG
jgi:hypothetical protein